MFPLFTKGELSKRWNVSINRLNNWEKRHDDFPPRISGIMAGSTVVYASSDVKAYEDSRGGAEGAAIYNATLGGRS
jgi:hypothetical protein